MISAVTYRRDLHQIPELGDQLPETTAYVRARLDALDLLVFSPTQGSVCAFLDAGKPETVAFRADMDALPVTEATGLPFASVHPGKMHACGHDGHTAMLLSLAERALERRTELPRNVLFLFQPAEETTGGAKLICEAGTLEKYRVSRVFGLHIWPNIEKGRVASCPGALLSRANEVDITITGKSVHISRFREGKDALTAGMEFLRLAYEMIETLPPEERRLLRFGKMTSGTVRNALSAQTVLQGCLRTYREETYHFCREQLETIGRNVANETGCAVDVHLNEGYPALWNNEALYREAAAVLGPDAPLTLEEPFLATDDFSFFAQRVPGVFFFLGAGSAPELHASNFTFDDETVLPAGVAFMEKLLFEMP